LDLWICQQNLLVYIEQNVIFSVLHEDISTGKGIFGKK
jgi:hypothetical protein